MTAVRDADPRLGCVDGTRAAEAASYDDGNPRNRARLRVGDRPIATEVRPGPTLPSLFWGRVASLRRAGVGAVRDSETRP
jgi:hypothetical protein